MVFYFFFQAEDGIRYYKVTGVQTCALPILSRAFSPGVITDGGKIVWVAGQTATRDNDNRDIANNFEAQVKQVFSQIDQIMKRAGGSLANVVSMTVFIKES